MYLMSEYEKTIRLHNQSARTLTNHQKTIRMYVRNCFMMASRDVLDKELEFSMKTRDTFRAECIRELIVEENASARDALKNVEDD